LVFSEQIQIYSDFFDRCLPQLVMKLNTFGSLMLDLGWELSDLEHLFRQVFEMSICHYLDLFEKALGLSKLLSRDSPSSTFAD
jgi:hypothetical protein